MKTKMIQEMTSEERMALQSEMEAFAPKLERLEKVANAQSPTMAWTPACGNYLPEGLRMLCSFKEAKPYAEDALINGKTADATKEFVVFWKQAKEKLNQIPTEKESEEEQSKDANETPTDDTTPIYEQDGTDNTGPDAGFDANSNAISDGGDATGDESKKSKKTQTRRGRN